MYLLRSLERLDPAPGIRAGGGDVTPPTQFPLLGVGTLSQVRGVPGPPVSPLADGLFQGAPTDSSGLSVATQVTPAHRVGAPEVAKIP